MQKTLSTSQGQTQAQARFHLLTKTLQRDTVPALSLTDPWGTLVASGAKRNETRSWGTRYRGPVAIHVSKGFPSWALDQCGDPYFAQALEDAGYTPPAFGSNPRNPWGFPLGSIIGVAFLEDCWKITAQTEMWEEDSQPRHIIPAVETPERAFGNYAEGRYVWTFSTVFRLPSAIQQRGSLMLWDWEPTPEFWSMIQAEHTRLQAEAGNARFQEAHS